VRSREQSTTEAQQGFLGLGGEAKFGPKTSEDLFMVLNYQYFTPFSWTGSFQFFKVKRVEEEAIFCRQGVVPLPPGSWVPGPVV
jgi:hypothetical protein